ncbi:two-component sensor histidine kinase [Paenibacillus baekrokdamisoli]|uniref:Two-component sensor histidine kinase n=1 Tax=Paenibacillus baekrokdamisoli TaxID=1712516 RepID=A0A3G9IV75_9BACL|nr:sensor histidine kinase [Paenibacillus baekrokdamisoli]MBB3068230.1 two-component system sensor histidine kinase YesM [Paenibacillus baekrokdamisoli]BBH22727.1 two-component sensor histidine kinase [Paenibacillus baekrokdamisoli]
MNLINFYRTHFQKKLFNKLLLIYSIITVVSLAVLSIFVYKYFTDTLVQKELDLNKQALDSVSTYLDNKYSSAQQIVKQLYQDNTVMEDVKYFLENDFDQYLRYRLNRYASSSGFTTQSFVKYFRNPLEDDTDIRSIALYSQKQNFVYMLQSNDMLKIYPSDMAKGAAGALSTIQKHRKIKKVYSIMKELNDPRTLLPLGELIIDYDSDNIAKAFRNYQKELKGYIVVLTPDNNVVYDSSNQYYDHSYPYMAKLTMSSSSAKFEEDSFINVMSNRYGFLIAGIIPKSQIYNNVKGLRNTILLITVLCIAAAIGFTYMTIINYSRRTKEIVRAMKKLQDGDLSVRIAVEKEDELFEISNRFNHMCEDLSTHIDQVYKSEIKQKQAELVAFQAQIKPHFLYNTLEAIRMRAISKEAHDVGEMIYLLATLFKYSVKSDTMVSVSDELEYSRLYLDLFRIRYKNKFAYSIEIDDELLNCRIMKLSIQPFIENYIVHGIRLHREDNEIAIAAKLDNNGKTFKITLRDNGKGMDPDTLTQIRERLCEPSLHPSQSIGITNVNERLKIIFGNGYELLIDSKQNEGTTIEMILSAT